MVPLGLLERGRLGVDGDAHFVIRMLAIVLMLQGCAILGDKRVAAGCQVADGLTSAYALKHGAVEANPLLSGLSPAGILLLKFAFAYIIYKAFPAPEKTTSGDKTLIGAVTLLGCVPAVNNVSVIRGMK